MGEPAGIGPELLVRIAQLRFDIELVVLAAPQLLKATAEKLAVPLDLTLVDLNLPDWQERTGNMSHKAGHLYVEAVELPNPVTCGELSSGNAPAILAMLTRASKLALIGCVDAIVTAPVHKANLNTADSKFLGHTEFLADAAGVNKVVMMLATNELRITLATTHLPLLEVPAAITSELLEETIKVILNSFSLSGLSQPRLAVCGLNPHAGEDGLLGHEEQEVITPLIKKLQLKGLSVSGPFPADTLFTPEKRQQYDVFLAMYHDQGLPVVKASGFGQCANITLGLPYIRTSVDHGTALDIASSYSASSDSLKYAIDYAIKLTRGELPE